MPRPAPLVAPVREQRSRTAHAGGASRLPPWLTSASRSGGACVPRAALCRRPSGSRAAAAIDARSRASGCRARARRISAYHPFDGEIDPSIVLRRARALGCERLLPGHHEPAQRAACGSSRRMETAGMDVDQPALAGPGAGAARRLRCARQQARHGRRVLRSAFRIPAAARAWRRPLLLGLAFEMQRVERLAEAAHDVPLWGIVTERGVYGARPRSATR